MFGDAETSQMFSSSYILLKPLFSKLLNQIVNELRDRCLHLILTACIRAEYRKEEREEKEEEGDVEEKRNEGSTIVVCPETFRQLSHRTCPCL